MILLGMSRRSPRRAPPRMGSVNRSTTAKPIAQRDERQTPLWKMRRGKTYRPDSRFLWLRSLLEPADQLGFRENVAFDCSVDLGASGFGLEARGLIERVELEKVMVRRALWRTRAAPPRLAVFVLALLRSIWKHRFVWSAFTQLMGHSRYVVNDPVHDRLFRV